MLRTLGERRKYRPFVLTVLQPPLQKTVAMMTIMPQCGMAPITVHKPPEDRLVPSLSFRHKQTPSTVRQ